MKAEKCIEVSFVDLHIHTPHSDGTLPVAGVLQTAQELGLSHLAISDHNTVSAYGELAACRHLFSGAVIPAVELTTTFRGEVVEVLGYGIDPEIIAPFTTTAYPDNNTRRIYEAGQITRALLAKGVRLGDKLVRQMCEEPESLDPGFHHVGCRPFLLAEMRKYPENAAFFKDEKDFMEMSAAVFSRNYLFNPATALYVDTSSLYPSMEQVIRQIHGAGGLAFLAHPFVYSPSVVAALDELVAEYGPDGLECHYGTFTEEQKEFLSTYCDGHGLYKSGGSDFHGLDARPGNPMGQSAGAPIPVSLMEPWLGKVKTL